MDLFRTAICCVLVAVLISDVIIAKPVRSSQIETLLTDIDNRLIRLEHRGEAKRHHRRSRGRRHVPSFTMSDLTDCFLHRNRCRRILNELRRQEEERQPTVIIVEK